MKTRSRKENKYCINCGKLLSLHGYFQCRQCYCSTHFKTKNRTCKLCGKSISLFATTSNRICRQCYDYNRSHQGKPWQDKKILEKLYYQDKLSVESISIKLGCGHTTLWKWMRRFKINIRPALWQKNNPNLINGTNNYVYLFMPEHPFATGRGFIFEHRYIVEAYLGRFLNSNEGVHHINGDKSNNLPENLYVFTSPQHTAFHNNPYPLISNLYNFQ